MPFNPTDSPGRRGPAPLRDPAMPSRRDFVATSLTLVASALLPRTMLGAERAPEPVIDIHQHHRYTGRPDDNLLFHQRTVGVTTTVLLPGGEDTGNPPTSMSLNAAVLEFVRAHPGRFHFFANARADADDARQEVEKYLKLGDAGRTPQALPFTFRVEVNGKA